MRRPAWLERREQGGNEVGEAMRGLAEHRKEAGFHFEKGAMEGFGVTERRDLAYRAQGAPEMTRDGRGPKTERRPARWQPQLSSAR